MSYQFDSDSNAPWYERWGKKLLIGCVSQVESAWTPSQDKMFWGLANKPTHKGQWGRRFLNGVWNMLAVFPPIRPLVAIARTAGSIAAGVIGGGLLATGVCVVEGLAKGVGQMLIPGYGSFGEGLLRVVGGCLGLVGVGIGVAIAGASYGAIPAGVPALGAFLATTGVISSVGAALAIDAGLEIESRKLADAPPPPKKNKKPGMLQKKKEGIKNAMSTKYTEKETVNNTDKLANTNTATRTAAVGAAVAGAAAVAHTAAKPVAHTATKPAHATATQAKPVALGGKPVVDKTIAPKKFAKPDKLPQGATPAPLQSAAQKPSGPGQSQTAAASPLGASMGALNAKAKGLTASNADPSTQQPGVRHMQANANAAPGADKTLTPTTPAIGPPTKIEAFNPELQAQFGAKIEHDSKLKTDVIRGRDVAGALDFAEKHELIPPGKQYVLTVPITATRPPERAMELANDIIAKMPAGKVTHVQIGDTKHEVILGVDGKNQLKKPEAAAVAQQPPSPAERRPSI